MSGQQIALTGPIHINNMQFFFVSFVIIVFVSFSSQCSRQNRSEPLWKRVLIFMAIELASTCCNRVVNARYVVNIHKIVVTDCCCCYCRCCRYCQRLFAIMYKTLNSTCHLIHSISCPWISFPIVPVTCSSLSFASIRYGFSRAERTSGQRKSICKSSHRCNLSP